ncbi:MAG: hypothetical protein J5553_04945, partial [Verrucomicrobia bacterium]|nr:hypothetical protein [Verrucomicrobiota bacterium]
MKYRPFRSEKNPENESRRSEQEIAENKDVKIYLLPSLMTVGNLFCGFLALTKIVEADIASANFAAVIRQAL